MNVRFVFLPAPAKLPRETSRFRSTTAKTYLLLQDELVRIGARQITIQAGFRIVRNDGWPYATTRPEHPACAVQFLDPKGNTLVFRAAQYKTFEDNLRAIAMTLEALRAVDRYGVVEGEQYAGFRQIAAPGESDSLGKAVTLIAFLAGEGHSAAAIIASPDAATSAYRAAAKKVHPDHQPMGFQRAGTWHELQAAKEQLDRHFEARAKGDRV